jgi:hypothetical protein
VVVEGGSMAWRLGGLWSSWRKKTGMTMIFGEDENGVLFVFSAAGL